MDAYDLSAAILDAWRKLVMNVNNSGSINKSTPKIYTCVVTDNEGVRRVVGCHIEGTQIILDLEGK